MSIGRSSATCKQYIYYTIVTISMADITVWLRQQRPP